MTFPHCLSLYIHGCITPPSGRGLQGSLEGHSTMAKTGRTGLALLDGEGGLGFRRFAPYSRKVQISLVGGSAHNQVIWDTCNPRRLSGLRPTQIHSLSQLPVCIMDSWPRGGASAWDWTQAGQGPGVPPAGACSLRGPRGFASTAIPRWGRGSLNERGPALAGGVM